MADFDYYGADYGVEEPSRLMDALRNFGFVNWAGALTSLGLAAGLGTWAVDLTFRDVSTVPVILAMEGPMRVEPADPGGTVAPFQGLALADITSGGSASASPDQIVLAPPPVTLDAPAQSDRLAALTEDAMEQTDATTSIDVVAATDAGDDALLDETTETDGLMTESDTGEAGADPFRAAIDAALASAVEPEAATSGIGSVRPRARPPHLRRLAATTPIEAPAQEAGIEVASAAQAMRTATDADIVSTREVDPSTLAAGTRVVQLGAFDSAAVARGEWDRLEGRFGAYLAGKSRMIEQARSGGRDFWRLRVVGFDDGADARRFCAELLAREAACIPVTMR